MVAGWVECSLIWQGFVMALIEGQVAQFNRRSGYFEKQ